MKIITRGHVKAGIDSVRSAKLRSFWTMLGIIIGVASVISVVAIGEGVKQQIGAQIHHSGSNIISVRPSQLTTGGSNSSVLSGLNVSGPLTAKDVQTVTHTAGLSASAPLTIAGGTLRGDNGDYKDGYVIGTTSDLPGLLNQSLSSGAFMDDQDVEANVAVLGQQAAQKIFNQDVPLGRTFSFHGEDFIVKGIFNTFSTAPLSQQADYNNAVFIPHLVAERLTNNTAPTYEILARADNGKNMKAEAAKIQTALDKSHGGSSGFSVLTGDQTVAASDNILELLTRLIAGVAAISLLVGGIGIMNVMLVSVAERTHEIGIRKAVGATNRQILSQFMIEAGILSFIGGVAGIIVALIIDLVFRLTTQIKPSVSWQIILIACGVSLAIGIIFGTVPAVKAARKDPIEALRAE